MVTGKSLKHQTVNSICFQKRFYCPRKQFITVSQIFTIFLKWHIIRDITCNDRLLWMENLLLSKFIEWNRHISNMADVGVGWLGNHCKIEIWFNCVSHIIISGIVHSAVDQSLTIFVICFIVNLLYPFTWLINQLLSHHETNDCNM